MRLCTILFCTAVLGGESAAPPDASTPLRHLEIGVSLFRSGDLQAALVEFRQAASTGTEEVRFCGLFNAARTRFEVAAVQSGRDGESSRAVLQLLDARAELVLALDIHPESSTVGQALEAVSAALDVSLDRERQDPSQAQGTGAATSDPARTEPRPSGHGTSPELSGDFLSPLSEAEIEQVYRSLDRMHDKTRELQRAQRPIRGARDW